MQQPRWGILATGWVAQQFAQDLRDHGHLLTAVGSRRLESARAFAAEFGIAVAHAHDSYESLVCDPEVDVVYVASPNPFHLDHALLALRAGKHVLVEKPFTLTALEARIVRDAARERGLVAMEAMWVRFLPHMAHVRSVIASGALGCLRGMIADHTRDLPVDPEHRINALHLGGGGLLDLGVYPVSLAHDLFGPPEEVAACGALKPTGVDEQVGLVLRHGDDVVSTIMTTTCAQGANQATILGTEARIEISPAWDPARVRLIARDGRVLADDDFTVSGRGMQFQAAEFERVLRGGVRESPLMPLDGCVEVMETLDLVRSRIGVAYPGDRHAE